MKTIGLALAVLSVLNAGFPAPRWASLTVTDDGVLLAWHPVPEAMGYRVWRLDPHAGEWSTLGTTCDTTFLDRDPRAAGLEKHYRMNGVDSELDESPPSPVRYLGEPDSTSDKGGHHGGNM